MTKLLCAIEDDPDMRFLIRATLRSDERLRVDCEADNFDDALSCVRANQPDLIILDHFIHGRIMGLQGAPELKAVAPHTKILLFTSHDLTVEAAREDSIDFFLKKGDIEHLLPVIQELLKL